jgi:hypothetical protein
MTAARLADKLMGEQHADVVGESVAWMAHQLMEAEVAAKIGPARPAQRLPATRVGHQGWQP